VSGASRGLGLAFAQALRDDGYAVVGLARTLPPDAPSGINFASCDVRDADEVRALTRAAVRDRGPVAICVNAAGIASMNHFVTTPGATRQRIMDVNYGGTANLMQAVLPGMIRARNGRIVNISTVAVRYDLEGEAAYVASKAAIEALTRTVAREVGDFGITVNAIAPPPIPTALLSGVPERSVEQLVGRQAIRRMGTAEDVVNVVRFLIAPTSSLVTGQVISLGGP